MLSTPPNALWGHILPLHPRRDTSTTALPPSDASTTRISVQPVQDRNATSLRVLLNSAEMSLQKFSSRVDELVLGVGEARAEVKHAGKLLDGVGDRIVGDVTSILNRMQGRVLEIIQDPAQQTTLLSLAAEHKAMSTKIDLMQLQLETFTAQQATLQASTNALQPLVFATEKLSTRLESFDSTTVGALAKLEGLVVELAGNLNDIRDIGRSSTNTSRKRHSSISPPLSPEFPPLKRRKFDLAPSSPEIVPSSQPNSVGDDESVDEPPSAVPTARSSTALPQLCPILFTPTQVEYNLNNQISPVPTPCPLAKQKTNLTQFHSSRSLKNTDGMVDSSQDANITEHSRPSFPQPPQIPPGREVHDHKQTPCQAIPQIPNLFPRQPPLFASLKTSNTNQPIPTTATLALHSPIIPPYVQMNLKAKATRRTITLDSDGEESQGDLVGQTCINMLADL